MGGCTTNKIPPRTWKWQIEEEKTKNFLLSYQQHVEQFKKPARFLQKDARVDGCEDHLSEKLPFPFFFASELALDEVCHIFGLTLTAPIIVMSPSGRTCDMYKIILQFKWKGNFKMWIGGTLPWEPGRELSGRHHQSETCAVYFLSRQFKKNVSPGSKEQQFSPGK